MADYTNLIEKTKEMQNAFVVASLTDEYIVDTWPMRNATLEGKEEKLLEVRVFNDKKEVKLFRSDVGIQSFGLRIIDDDNLPEDWDCLMYTADDQGNSRKDYQEQYLDVNTDTSPVGKTMVRTTGGGYFYLPVDEPRDAQIKIKHYVKRDPDSGMAILVDWRAAGIKEA